MKNRLKKIFIFLLFILLPVIGFASAKSLMERGLRDYDRKNYHEAFVRFNKVYHQLPIDVNPYASSSLYMMIRSLYYQDRHDEVITWSGIFLHNFSQSRYYADVLFIQSKSLLKTNRYFLSASFALKSGYAADYESLRTDALDLARKISSYYLSPNDLNALRVLAGSRSELRYIDLLLADKLNDEGENAAARRILAETKSTLMELFEVSYYNQILEKTAFTRKRVDLAVILPLSGGDHQHGKSLINGMLYALDRFKNDLMYDVNLVILDNESDIRKSIQYAEFAGDMKDVIAIVGPLTSADAIAMAPVCKFKNIPMFMPTATRDGLAGMGLQLFQLNPDQDERAYALASYSMDSLKYETFAILAPADDYGRRISDSFSETVAKKGGRVIRREWFSDANDLKSQFSRIRRTAFELQAADTLDTTNVLLNPDLVLKTASDSLKIPLKSVDAFFLPVYQHHIQTVAPQLAFYNFNTRLLGDGNWLDEELLSRYRRYVNGIIISADHVMLANDTRFRTFSEEYFNHVGVSPDRLTIYGYETMVLMLNFIENGYTSRESLKNAMTEMGEFKGVIRNIRFTDRKPRVNTAVRILEYNNNTIRTLQE